MNIIAINGSPRKNGNTATLLEKALEGAASQGGKTTLVHLYDIPRLGIPRSIHSRRGWKALTRA
jgi:multimeric flavodoxin WrbA